MNGCKINYRRLDIMAKGFGVSPITNTIYYGTQNKEKHMWTGKKRGCHR